MKALIGTVAALVIGAVAIVGWVYLGSDSEAPVAATSPEPAAIEEFSLDAASRSGDHSSSTDERRSVAEILEHVVHPANQEATIATLLSETGIQIGATITVDTQTCRDAGIHLERMIRFKAPRQSGRARIDALMRHFDPDGRLQFSALVDRQGSISFAVTTANAAEQRHLLPVPTDRALVKSKAAPPQEQPRVPPSSPFVNASNRSDPADVRIRRTVSEFDRSFEGILLQLADRMDMELWLDILLADRNFSQRASEVRVVPGLPAQVQLAEILTHLDKDMVAVIAKGNENRQALIITTKDQAIHFVSGGRRVPLRQVLRSHDSRSGGVVRIERPDTDAMFAAAGLGHPIVGDPQDMPLDSALRIVAAQASLSIRIEPADLEAIGVKPDVVVHFEPRGREARAVLYELLRAADGPRESSVIYRFEKTKDGRFALVVTTREAAARSGRTIPFDFNLSPDDI